MNIKALSIALLATAFTAIASGCNITDLSSDNLLRPPKPIGDEAEIEQIISDTAGGNYILKYPKNGNHRSAITMQDIDYDESEEAIAFYRKSDDVAKIHMLVMYCDNGEWKLSSDFITETTDIDCVDFAQIDGEDSLEIIVGYTTYSPNTNFLSCYRYSNGKTSQINAGQTYSAFFCGDFTSNNKNEVMTLSLYSAENEATATMLDYNKENNTLYAKSSASMDPNIIKFKNIQFTDFGNDCKGIVVDGEAATTELSTQIIYYNKEMSLLRNPLYREKTQNVTRRSCSVISTDLDNDGIVEFPTVEKLPYSKNESAETVADKITWNLLSTDNESVAPKSNVIANYNFGYTIKMADKWLKSNVTAIHNAEENTTTVYEWKNNKLGEKLFDIRVFDTSEWEKGKNNDEYTLIYKDNQYSYTFRNTDTENKLALTDDEIKTAFSILTDAVV